MVKRLKRLRLPSASLCLYVVGWVAFAVSLLVVMVALPLCYVPERIERFCEQEDLK